MKMHNDIDYKLHDLRHLVWDKARQSSGTAGSLLKSSEKISGKKLYYKLSDYDYMNGIHGHECINEIIAGRLMDYFKINHLKYILLNSVIKIQDKEYTTWLCISEDFKKIGESKITFENFYQLEKDTGESPMDFCIRKGFADYIYEMLLVDFLICNRDRHGANMEILRNSKEKSFRPAPLYDHGLSFLCRCLTKEEAERFDVMEDKRVQSFIGNMNGASSCFENLKYIPLAFLQKLPFLTKDAVDFITEGTEELLPDGVFPKIREMLIERWNYIENLRNKR